MRLATLILDSQNLVNFSPTRPLPLDLATLMNLDQKSITKLLVLQFSEILTMLFTTEQLMMSLHFWVTSVVLKEFYF